MILKLNKCQIKNQNQKEVLKMKIK